MRASQDNRQTTSYSSSSQRCTASVGVVVVVIGGGDDTDEGGGGGGVVKKCAQDRADEYAMRRSVATVYKYREWCLSLVVKGGMEKRCRVIVGGTSSNGRALA